MTIEENKLIEPGCLIAGDNLANGVLVHLGMKLNIGIIELIKGLGEVPMTPGYTSNFVHTERCKHEIRCSKKDVEVYIRGVGHEIIRKALVAGRLCDMRKIRRPRRCIERSSWQVCDVLKRFHNKVAPRREV